MRFSCAKELSIEMYAFAVDLLDIILGWIRKAAGIEVPADAGLVADVEVDLLAFESGVDGFCDVAL